MAPDTIPTVDLDPYFCGPHPGEEGFPSLKQRCVSEEISAAFKGLGFLYLDGLDFAGESLDSMFRHAQSMFSRSAEEKSSDLMPITRPAHVGYFGYGSERLNSSRSGDMKEVCIVSLVSLVFCYLTELIILTKKKP